MSVNIEFYKEITTYLSLNKVQLIAVSKTKPNEAILDLHQLGHKDFGESFPDSLRVTAPLSFHKNHPACDASFFSLKCSIPNFSSIISLFLSLFFSLDSLRCFLSISSKDRKNQFDSETKADKNCRHYRDP